MTKRYEVDGKPIASLDALRNELCAGSYVDWAQIEALRPGQSMPLGGGAFAEYTIACTEDPASGYFFGAAGLRPVAAWGAK